MVENENEGSIEADIGDFVRGGAGGVGTKRKLFLDAIAGLLTNGVSDALS